MIIANQISLSIQLRYFLLYLFTGRKFSLSATIDSLYFAISCQEHFPIF